MSILGFLMMNREKMMNVTINNPIGAAGLIFNIDQQESLKDWLRKGPVTVEFTKVNGDRRVMVCTTNTELILNAIKLDPSITPDRADPDWGKTHVGKNTNTLRVWEIHTGWRSFRLDSVISITPVEVIS